MNSVSNELLQINEQLESANGTAEPVKQPKKRKTLVSSLALVLAAGLSACTGGSSSDEAYKYTTETTIAAPLPCKPKPLSVPKGSHYFYAGESQYVNADGVSASIGTANPSLGKDGDHSLVTVGVQSCDRTQGIELGWSVDKNINDQKPRLFVFDWVDGEPRGYSSSDYVPVQNKLKKSNVGQDVTLAIEHESNQWQLFYNGAEIGYYPDSVWHDKFKKLGYVQIFGEVHVTTLKPCTQMGNGLLSENPDALRVSNIQFQGADAPVNMKPHIELPGHYTVHQDSNNSFRLGGPGYC